VHIGGMTVHSFAGIGKGEDGVVELKDRIKRNKRLRKHWQDCRVLIIDEVSMVFETNGKADELSDDLFDKIDEIGRHVRGNGQPFGGVQLVLCGDFYQLPPVPVLCSPPVTILMEGSLKNDGVRHAAHSNPRLRHHKNYSALAKLEKVMMPFHVGTFSQRSSVIYSKVGHGKVRNSKSSNSPRQIPRNSYLNTH